MIIQDYQNPGVAAGTSDAEDPDDDDPDAEEPDAEEPAEDNVSSGSLRYDHRFIFRHMIIYVIILIFGILATSLLLAAVSSGHYFEEARPGSYEHCKLILEQDPLFPCPHKGLVVYPTYVITFTTIVSHFFSLFACTFRFVESIHKAVTVLHGTVALVCFVCFVCLIAFVHGAMDTDSYWCNEQSRDNWIFDVKQYSTHTCRDANEAIYQAVLLSSGASFAGITSILSAVACIGCFQRKHGVDLNEEAPGWTVQNRARVANQQQPTAEQPVVDQPPPKEARRPSKVLPPQQQTSNPPPVQPEQGRRQAKFVPPQQQNNPLPVEARRQSKFALPEQQTNVPASEEARRPAKSVLPPQQNNPPPVEARRQSQLELRQQQQLNKLPEGDRRQPEPNQPQKPREQQPSPSGPSRPEGQNGRASQDDCPIQ